MLEQELFCVRSFLLLAHTLYTSRIIPVLEVKLRQRDLSTSLSKLRVIWEVWREGVFTRSSCGGTLIVAALYSTPRCFLSRRILASARCRSGLSQMCVGWFMDMHLRVRRSLHLRVYMSLSKICIVKQVHTTHIHYETCCSILVLC